MQYFFFFLSLVITIIYCEIRAKKRAGKEKLGLELKPSSTFHLKDYRSQGHENNLKPHWEKSTKKRSCKKIKISESYKSKWQVYLVGSFSISCNCLGDEISDEDVSISTRHHNADRSKTDCDLHRGVIRSGDELRSV